MEGVTYTPDMVMGAPRKGIKLTYCTDTRPVQSIEDKEAKAREYKHMTFYEAADIARKAEVKEMWLTHYSPSLVRPSDYVKNIKSVYSNVCAAKDGQSVTLTFEDEE